MAKTLTEMIDTFVKGISTGLDLLAFVESAERDPAVRQGGIFHKPGRAFECRTAQDWVALQSRKGYSNKNEVSLTRALFNLAKITVGNEVHHIISYEAPLLRTQASNSRQVSCDLVTMTRLPTGSFALTTVEAKCRDYSSGVTSLPFAVLESWAYARVLAAVLDRGGERPIREELIENWNLRTARAGTNLLTRDDFKLEKMVRHAVLFTENRLGTGAPIIVDALRKLEKSNRLEEKERWVTEHERSTRFDGYWVIRNKVWFREGNPGEGIVKPCLEQDSGLQIHRFPDWNAMRGTY